VTEGDKLGATSPDLYPSANGRDLPSFTGSRGLRDHKSVLVFCHKGSGGTPRITRATSHPDVKIFGMKLAPCDKTDMTE